jgi:hypothetical protein
MGCCQTRDSNEIILPNYQINEFYNNPTNNYPTLQSQVTFGNINSLHNSLSNNSTNKNYSEKFEIKSKSSFANQQKKILKRG